MSTANLNPTPQSLRVVAIGGGTGLSTLLRGLRRYVAVPGQLPIGNAKPGCDPCLITDLAALVTVTDDGGSSGRLRKGFNMLPPGDLRNCMVALSEEEDLIARLFRHRFRSGGGRREMEISRPQFPVLLFRGADRRPRADRRAR